MKRFFYPILWSSVLSLLVLTLFVFEQGTRAESNGGGQPERKVSKDILKKVADGRGGDFVRVIIQPASAADSSIDSTIEYSGGSNIRKFRNFAVRVATLPAHAAVNLASRSDVAYVSLNRDVRPMGHVSRTTGADLARGPRGPERQYFTGWRRCRHRHARFRNGYQPSLVSRQVE